MGVARVVGERGTPEEEDGGGLEGEEGEVWRALSDVCLL